MAMLYPQALWLLLALPLVWLLGFAARRDHAPPRLLGSVVLRSTTLTLLILAIAQPRLFVRDESVSVVYALDISRSVAPASVSGALEWIRTANARFQPSEAHYLVFADRARYVASVDDVPAVDVSFTERSDRTQTVAQGATDIEQALRAAVPAFGPGGERRLVLFTDGVQTRGDFLRELPRLDAAKVRVFAVPMQVAAEHDAWVDAIRVPEGVRRDEPITVQVTVQAQAAMPARVQLATGGRSLGARSVNLRFGINDIGFDVALPEAGATTLVATVRAEGDTYAGNDTLAETVWVGPHPRVLYVDGVPESARYLAEALRAHHLDVTVASTEALATGEVSVDASDVVFLSDVFVQGIDARTVAKLEAFVRDRGGGLIFAAGESTYGEKGLAGSSVENMLPVRFEGKRKRRDLDLVLLIDRSHSMRGGKLERAKTASLSTLDMLEPRHRLAVVAFDARPYEVVPLVPVGNKRRAEDLISSMTARGQTSIYPALVEAQRLLAASSATTKHVILLSDGVTVQPPASGGAPTAAQIQAAIRKGREEEMRQQGIPVPPPEATEVLPEPGAIETVVEELAQAKVTVSTVAIGDKPNVGLMRDIAAIGKGRSYVAHDDAEIPSLFVSETRRLLGESLVEEAFRPVVAHRTAVLAGVDFDRGPPLQGMSVARAKTFADVLLRGPKEQPLLVTTHYGLGKTVAFLSDVKNRWSSAWIGWEGYGRFWAQVVRDCVSRADERNVVLRVTRSKGEALIELRALASDRSYRSGLSPSVHITAPSGTQSTLVMQQVAPGVYSARAPIEAGQTQPYRFELTEGGGVTRADLREAGIRSLSYSWSDELRGLPVDAAALRLLSDRTGGAYAARAEEIFALKGDGGRVPRPLWPILLAIALGAFLLDILWRRLRWAQRSRRTSAFSPLG